MNLDTKRGSWDVLLLGDNFELKSPPIFVEIKSSFDNPSDLIAALKEKIILTNEIIKNSRDSITSQMLGNQGEEVKTNFDKAEFVLFTPGAHAQRLLEYVTSHQDLDEKISFVIWGYNFQDSHTKVIWIPYSRRPNIKTCKNTNELDCKVCLCIHEDKTLMQFITDLRSQSLESARIIPSKRKDLDRAINIISVLSYGEVFPRKEKHITETDIKDRINSFLSKFYILPNEDVAGRLLGEMIKAGILIRSGGLPLVSYHLSSSVSTSNEDVLIEEVSKRAIRKLHDTRTLEEFR